MSDSVLVDRNIISKRGSEFSFVEEFFNEITNDDFKNGVTRFNISSDNPNTHIYHSISAIADEIGSRIYENILNYVDNVSNIDYCKVKSLQNHSNILGTEYTIFSYFNNMPNELQNIVDILSLPREFLVNSSKIRDLFVDYLEYNCCAFPEGISSISSDLSSQFTDLSSFKKYIDGDAFAGFLSSTYYQTIVDNIVNARYDQYDADSSIVYNYNNYQTYIQNDHKLFVRDQETLESIRKLKTESGILQSFDEEGIVDDIENGCDRMDNYDYRSQQVLQIEMDYRKRLYSSTKNYTRYFYYKVRKVQEYIDFVETMYIRYGSLYKNVEVYDIDSSYLELTIPDKVQILSCDSTNNVIVDFGIIQQVAVILSEITVKICSLRQKMKSIAQKYNMRGTFQILEDMVGEYLVENILPVVRKYCPSAQYNANTTFLEKKKYLDTTEYFNISTENDQIFGISSKTNPRYWTQHQSISSYVPQDTTNVFRPSTGEGAKDFSFDQQKIDKFYLNGLQSQFQITDEDLSSVSSYVDEYGQLCTCVVYTGYEIAQKKRLSSFLDNVFDSAADDTTLISGDILSSDCEDMEYKEKLFRIYSGNISALHPYCNVKNENHPSYQIHPYMKNFVDSVPYHYPIENITNLIQDTMFELLKENIDKYIDGDGYLLDVWKNPLVRNSDYLSRYESSRHRDCYNQENAMFAYEGFGYPKFLSKVIQDYNADIDGMHEGLNLSKTELERIRNQISYVRPMFGKSMIRTVAKDEYYDIYRYGIDIYSNSYILLKKYDGVNSAEDIGNVSKQTRDETPGQLWIRLANNPIPFPAYVIANGRNRNDISQIYVDQNTSMEKIIDAELFTGEFDGIPKIYDFFISESKNQILLKAKCTYGTDKNRFIDSVLACKISQKYSNDINFKRNILKFDVDGNKDEYSEEGSILENGYCFSKFIQFYEHPGFISTRLSSVEANRNLVDVMITYFNKDYPESTHIMSKQPFECVDAVNMLSDSIKTDFQNNVISLCYIKRENGESLSVDNFLGVGFDYRNISQYGISSFDNSVVIQKMYATRTGMTTKDYLYDKIYMPYTDIGFFPLMSDTLSSVHEGTANDMSYTSYIDRLNDTGILKFQMIGEEILSGIDYKQFLPIRMYEKYSLCASYISSYYDYVTGRSYDLSAIGFNMAHFYQKSEPMYTGNEISYNPYKLYKLLKENNENGNLKLQVKIDESFNRTFKPIARDNYFLKYDRYAINPWLLKGENGFIPRHYRTPGWYDSEEVNQVCKDGISADTNNQFLLKIDPFDEQYLSVCWQRYQSPDMNGETCIKIDFNPAYFNHEMFGGIRNDYNYQHTFLNLDYPGAAGFLKIYDWGVNKPSQFTDRADQMRCFYDSGNVKYVLFIKNLSTPTHPRFLMVTDWSRNKFGHGKELVIDVIAVDAYSCLALSASDGDGFDVIRI